MSDHAFGAAIWGLLALVSILQSGVACGQGQSRSARALAFTSGAQTVLFAIHAVALIGSFLQ